MAKPNDDMPLSIDQLRVLAKMSVPGVGDGNNLDQLARSALFVVNCIAMMLLKQAEAAAAKQ